MFLLDFLFLMLIIKFNKKIKNIKMSKYKEIYYSSIKNKEDFWKKISDDIFWYEKPTKILNTDNPPFYKWFEDGITNTCYNALDHHINNGRGEKIAIIYDSPITDTQKKLLIMSCEIKLLCLLGH